LSAARPGWGYLARGCAGHSAYGRRDDGTADRHGRFLSFTTRQYGGFRFGQIGTGGERRNSVEQWPEADVAGAGGEPLPRHARSGGGSQVRATVGFNPRWERQSANGVA